MQTVIAISLLVCAGLFLGWNYIGKNLTSKSPEEPGDCGPDCKCG